MSPTYKQKILSIYEVIWLSLLGSAFIYIVSQVETMFLHPQPCISRVIVHMRWYICVLGKGGTGKDTMS